MTEPDSTSVQDLNKIRGWLLVLAVILIPHGVGAPLMLTLQLPLDSPVSGAEALGVATLTVTAVGNLSGIFLIFSRNRIAPAFFTIYFPLLVLLYILDPDPIATANARLTVLGSADEMSPVRLRVLEMVNFGLAAFMVGYWVRSKRVEAVFGTKGLALLRGTGQKFPCRGL